MIPVGIHDDLIVSKAVKNDKGSLVIGVKQVTEIDPLEVLSTSGDNSFDAPEQDFLIYPIKVTNYKNELETVQGILDKIKDLRAPLDHILSFYLPTNKIKWTPFEGAGVSKTTMDVLLNQTALDKVYDNLANQFIAMITPFLNKEDKKFRMLFIRQSEAKHYSSFRKRYLESQPFMEPMEIPKASSKLAYSKYEIGKKLNDPTPAGGAQAVSTSDATAASALFGN